jgi:hypothetical protein
VLIEKYADFLIDAGGGVTINGGDNGLEPHIAFKTQDSLS